MNPLNGFSKVYERFINDNMLSIMPTFQSNFVSAGRKHYSLLAWKKNLNNNKIVSDVFTDL